ncbi:hypothetical protein Tco_0744155, partial [Tanacetum coccineum]
VVFRRRCICLFDLAACHLVEVLRMISEAELQVLADLKSILYGLRSEKFGIELCVELKCRVAVPEAVVVPIPTPLLTGTVVGVGTCGLAYPVDSSLRPVISGRRLPVRMRPCVRVQSLR